MPKTKLEVVFVKLSSEPSGFTVLGNFDMESDGSGWINLPTPSVGERIVLELPNRNFAGLVTHKATMYSQKDIAGNVWDWVTRIVLTLELDDPPSSGADRIGVMVH